MRNKQVADHLRLLANMTVLDGGNRFRVAAYKDAADAVDHGGQVIEEVEDLASIEGIGSKISRVIEDFLTRGTSFRLEELEAKVPGATEAMTMTVVDGIGAKTAWKFYKEKGIHNFDELFAAAERGELREKMTTNVKFAKEKLERVPRASARVIADFVVNSLRDVVDKIQVCGSYRRGRATSKDIDVVALVPPHAKREEVFECFTELGEVIGVGDKKASVWVTQDDVTMQVDLWLVDEWYWGSALHYATGSKDHVKDIRGRAKASGYTVNEYGVFPAGTVNGGFNPDNQLAGRTEESMYNFFGLLYPEPEDREDKAEIA